MPTADPRALAATVTERLRKARPDARYELDWKTPEQLLVATILAAQCTDERVNRVTAELFPKYPDAAALANADTAVLEEILRPTGYYRQKTKSVQATCRALVDRFGGKVPRKMEDMLTLPGVARKTANVVLTNAFGLATGIIVDTHVARVSQRMGLSATDKPDDIERDLMTLVPKEDWVFWGPAVVLHGRYVCTAAAPKCGGCLFEDVCPKLGVSTSTSSAAADSEEEPDDAPKPAAKAAAKAAPRAVAKAAPAKVNAAKVNAAKVNAAKVNAAKVNAAKVNAAKVNAPKANATGSAADELAVRVPVSWRAYLEAEFAKPYWPALAEFVAAERAAHQVFPPPEEVFTALELTPYDEVRAVLLGQDPYHDDDQAHGLCFSVKPGIKPPPSLLNMYKELASDVGSKPPKHGYLTAWARQGLLMIKAVLTVRAHEPNSHKDQGWESFTDAIIRAVNNRDRPVVFLLWGGYAQKKIKLIDEARHAVLKTAHPSPLSVAKFLGSRPFSACNEALNRLGHPAIDWQLPMDV